MNGGKLTGDPGWVHWWSFTQGRSVSRVASSLGEHPVRPTSDGDAVLERPTPHVPERSCVGILGILNPGVFLDSLKPGLVFRLGGFSPTLLPRGLKSLRKVDEGDDGRRIKALSSIKESRSLEGCEVALDRALGLADPFPDRRNARTTPREK